MTLSCRDTNETLHNCGRVVLRGYLDNKSGGPYKLASKPEDDPIIPATVIFQQGATDSPTRLPTVSECATHLEFLETLYVLRERILRSEEIDKTMGITRNRETKTGYNGDTKTLKDTTFETRRQKKWDKFVEFAVARFLGWRARLADETADSDKFAPGLPPLDIIMVWHTLLLNPLLFNKHCRTEKLYLLPLPWRTIHGCINNRDWSFTLNRDDGEFPSLFDLFSTWNSNLPGHDASKFGLSSFGLDMFSAAPAVSKPSQSQFPSVFGTLSLTTALKPSVAIPPSKSEIASLPSGNPIRTHAEMFLSLHGTLATALKAAVLRQVSFIDKMHSHLWIRSPALHGTLSRSLSRYSNFLLLMKRNPGKMMVPTLDIDLAWHTHQCTGYNYVKSVKELVGRFVNHDDSIAKGTLDTGADETRRLWRVTFGGEYRVCGCWDCEALVSEIEREMGLLTKAEREEKGEVAQEAGETGQKVKEVGEVENREVDMQAVVKRVEDEVRFYRAVEAARRKGGALPVRQ